MAITIICEFCSGNFAKHIGGGQFHHGFVVSWNLAKGKYQKGQKIPLWFYSPRWFNAIEQEKMFSSAPLRSLILVQVANMAYRLNFFGTTYSIKLLTVTPAVHIHMVLRLHISFSARTLCHVHQHQDRVTRLFGTVFFCQ